MVAVPPIVCDEDEDVASGAAVVVTTLVATVDGAAAVDVAPTIAAVVVAGGAVDVTAAAVVEIAFAVLDAADAVEDGPVDVSVCSSRRRDPDVVVEPKRVVVENAVVDPVAAALVCAGVVVAGTANVDACHGDVSTQPTIESPSSIQATSAGEVAGEMESCTRNGVRRNIQFGERKIESLENAQKSWEMDMEGGKKQ